MSAETLPFVHRLTTTPLDDLLRGRLTARLSPRRAILDADLPAPLKSCVANTVQRTHLWRGERLAVAMELIEHFQDGLASGRTAEQLLERFGSPATTARLMRRAMKRKRSLWWRGPWFAARAMVAAVALALLIAIGIVCAGIIRLHVGSAQVKRDFVFEVNRALPAVAPGDVAWPTYVEASESLTDLNDWTNPAPRPGDERWPEFVEYLAKHADSIAAVREAATRPALGATIDPQGRGAIVPTDVLPPTHPAHVGSLYQSPIVHIMVTHRLFELLRGDLQAAVADGDAQRVRADLDALLGIARQLHESPLPQASDSGLSYLGAALKELLSILSHHPALLDDATLRDLAHRIAAIDGGRFRVDLGPWRLMFADLLQRTFTDDGAGGGHLTALGAELFKAAPPTPPRPWIDTALGLATAITTASRKDLGADHERRVAALEDWTAARHWQRPALPPVVLDWPMQSTIDPVRIARQYVPPPGGLASTIDRAELLRSAALAAIAVLLFEREHGAWPASLAELVPRWLPEVPRDEFTGGPLRYGIVDGRPTIWSRGIDGDDDGAAPLKATSGGPIEDPWQAIGLFQRGGPSAYGNVGRLFDGDLVLWLCAAGPA